MDFSGEKYATFDEKGRVVFPAEFKNAMGGTVSEGQMAVEIDPYEKCLNLYPMEEWHRQLAMYKSRLNRNNPKESRMLDLLYRNFKLVVVADSGRMNFPNNFLTKVNITKDVVFAGSGERIRLWDKGEYTKYTADDSEDGDFASRFFQYFGNANAEG